MAKKLKKRRKPNLKSPNSMTWRSKADNAWRDLDKEPCAVCIQRGTVNPSHVVDTHHIINRTRLRFRHIVLNRIRLCTWHHKRDQDCSPHYDTHSDMGFLTWLEAHSWVQWEWFLEAKEDKRVRLETYQSAYERLVQHE